jgi:hypothetical protein
MPAIFETTPPLPGLSPVNGKAVTARFDGGSLSSDAGLLALREVERRLGVADRLAAGYEDGIDANARRARPLLAVHHQSAGEPARPAHAAVHGSRDDRVVLRQLRAEAPQHITLDIDDTFGAVHGGQQLRLFNAHYDD